MKKIIPLLQSQNSDDSVFHFPSLIETIDTLYDATLTFDKTYPIPKSSNNNQPVYGSFSNVSIANEPRITTLTKISREVKSLVSATDETAINQLKKIEKQCQKIASHYCRTGGNNLKNEKLAVALRALCISKEKLHILCEDPSKKLKDLLYETERILEIRRHLCIQNLKKNFSTIEKKWKAPIPEYIKTIVNQSIELELQIPGLWERERMDLVNQGMKNQAKMKDLLVKRYSCPPTFSATCASLIQGKSACFSTWFIPFHISEPSKHTIVEITIDFIRKLYKTVPKTRQDQQEYRNILNSFDGLIRAMIDYFIILTKSERYLDAALIGHSTLDILKNLYVKNRKSSTEHLKNIGRSILDSGTLYELQKRVAYSYQEIKEYDKARDLFRDLFILDRDQHQSCLHHVVKNDLLQLEAQKKDGKKDKKLMIQCIKLIEGVMITPDQKRGHFSQDNPDDVLFTASRLRIIAELKLEHLDKIPFSECIDHLNKGLEILDKYSLFKTYELRYEKAAIYKQLGKTFEEKYALSKGKKSSLCKTYLEKALDAYCGSRDMLLPMLKDFTKIAKLLAIIDRIEQEINPESKRQANAGVEEKYPPDDYSSPSLLEEGHSEDPYVFLSPEDVNQPNLEESEPTYVEMKENRLRYLRERIRLASLIKKETKERIIPLYQNTNSMYANPDNNDNQDSIYGSNPIQKRQKDASDTLSNIDFYYLKNQKKQS